MKGETVICVVGAAGGGLSAAVRAAQKGAGKVIVLEKMKAPGGCTNMAAGIMALDSPVQHRFGYYYNVDDCYRRLMEIFNWEVDAMLVRKWLKGTGESIRWLEEMGMEFDSVAPFNGVRDKCLSTYHYSKSKGYRTGMWIIRTLLNEASRLGVEVHTETRAKKIVRGEDGCVCGVVAEGPGGEFVVKADAVILATGSISSNKDLIHRFYQSDEYKDIRIMANVPHNTGDGLIMAEEIGAGAGAVSTLYIGPHNHFKGASEITGSLIRRPYPIRVNRNGERVSDEGTCLTSDFGWMIGVNLDKQPGKVIYGIANASMVEYLRKNVRAPMTVSEELVTFHGDFEHSVAVTGACVDEAALREGEWLDRIEAETKKEETAGRAKIAQSLDEAAAFIGCDPAILKKTVNDYNRFCKQGYDEEFLKDPRFLLPLTTPPYYIYRGPSGIDTCIGGLRIDNCQRVLDRDAFVIPGLYAAGVLTSGWCARNYAFFGSEMSYTIYSGRTAGENALAYATAAD